MILQAENFKNSKTKQIINHLLSNLNESKLNNISSAMNSESWKLMKQLLPETYVQQANNAANSRKNIIQEFLQHRNWPKIGWKDDLIEQFLSELASMDSNNFVTNCGLGEREARFASDIVARRHFRLGHGIGRSGNLTEIQPKAAGSSLMSQLVYSMIQDSLKLMGIQSKLKCLLVPMATGMSLVISMLTLKQQRPNSKYVIWSRIDQKSCFKSILTAGCVPVIINCIKNETGELQTNLVEIEKQINELGVNNILCLMTTTSCFAPRACDSIEDVAEIAKNYDVPHIVNNAYGLQSSYCIHQIQAASKKGRVDIFVQSTDKNFLVPVGGTIIAGYNEKLISDIASNYPGRASSSPMVDLFITMLHLGQNGYLELCNERKRLHNYLKEQMTMVANEFNEKVVCTSHNPISIAMTLKSIDTKNLTQLGSMLFVRNVSGTRVVKSTDIVNISGFKFIGWGSHCDDYGSPYLTAAASIGVKQCEIDVYIKKLRDTLRKLSKV